MVHGLLEVDTTTVPAVVQLEAVEEIRKDDFVLLVQSSVSSAEHTVKAVPGIPDQLRKKVCKKTT